jgi:hypothetical protein
MPGYFFLQYFPRLYGVMLTLLVEFILQKKCKNGSELHSSVLGQGPTADSRDCCIKISGSYQLSGGLIAHQNGLCPMELVSCLFS